MRGNGEEVAGEWKHDAKRLLNQTFGRLHGADLSPEEGDVERPQNLGVPLETHRELPHQLVEVVGGAFPSGVLKKR